MLKITYEINGRKTTPGSLKNAIEGSPQKTEFKVR